MLHRTLYQAEARRRQRTVQRASLASLAGTARVQRASALRFHGRLAGLRRSRAGKRFLPPPPTPSTIHAPTCPVMLSSAAACTACTAAVRLCQTRNQERGAAGQYSSTRGSALTCCASRASNSRLPWSASSSPHSLPAPQAMCAQKQNKELTVFASTGFDATPSARCRRTKCLAGTVRAAGRHTLELRTPLSPRLFSARA